MVSRNGTINTSGNTSGEEKSFTIMGVAKGSGMIRPDMATMLSYIFTDADVSSSLLVITSYSIHYTKLYDINKNIF